ncbi:GSCOCG00010336001-RA-CDS [Cotesia congregata]|nr:GSCOCG00010336001-RA-CDS [Cotesia congregata]
MGQGTECADRPTEVSVIRFVSRNRTIEEIAPKKEIYTCKQQGCGKIFTNQDEYKTHEALEELKIRFICREPGCGKELSDPGTMWRHYQEYHSNETTNIFICPYTSCGGSIHTSSVNLEQHIENSHRHTPALIPTEPEIICFEGPGSTTSTTGNHIVDDDDDDDETLNDDECIEMIDEKINIIINNNKSNDSNNKNRLIIPEENYDNRSNDSAKLFITSDNKDTNHTNNSNSILYDNKQGQIKLQEHRIDLGNLEKVFRSGFEDKTLIIIIVIPIKQQTVMMRMMKNIHLKNKECRGVNKNYPINVKLMVVVKCTSIYLTIDITRTVIKYKKIRKLINY